ncbi:MAG: hypothetical protein U1F43_25715 [Myxococcota bacterium]
MPLSPTSWWSVLHRFVSYSACLAVAACGGSDTGTTSDTQVSQDSSITTDVEDTTVVVDTLTTPPTDTLDDGADTTVTPDTSDAADTSVEPDTSVETDTSVATDAIEDEVTPETVEETTTSAEVVDDTDAVEEVVDTCGNATGRGEGCACDDKSQCASDLCADGPMGSYCTTVCSGDGDCDPDTGSTCVVPVGQTKGLCLVEEDFLCVPCSADADCRRAGGDATCVAEGIAGSFCATSCANVGDCPDGFSCNGSKCVPTSGTCGCSDVAVGLAAQTPCATTNSFGTCSGIRVCAGDGTLTACNAATPKNEVCNGVDDDCDVQVDEVSGACSDGDPCTQDICAGIGGCQHPAVADSPVVTCNDNNPATTGDQCVGGVCTGIEVDCTPATVATKCVSPPSGKDLACVTPTCDGQNKCSYPNKTGSCSDGNACTEADTCQAGACKGTTKDCTDTDLCTIDSCDSGTGCKHVTTTGACEDGDPCTTGDTCATGQCVGDEVDCSNLDDACHQGVCNGAGGCFAQVLACGVASIRLHMPSAAFSTKGSGGTWLVGSAGHQSPVGNVANTKHKVQFGFHPGMHH